MASCVADVRAMRDRTILFVATPALWPTWPFLPVIRRSQGREELGVVFDARSVCGLTGYSTTVWLTNLFALPPTLDQFLKLPKEVFDGVEELTDSGWRVD